MKNKAIRRLAAGIFAVAMAVTMVPAAPAVDAQAKSLKVQEYQGITSKKQGTYVGKYTDCSLALLNINKKATYSVRSLSRGMTVTKQSYSKNGNDGWIFFSYEIKNAGSYKIQVTEKANGRTKTVKNFTVYASEPKAARKATIYVGQEDIIGPENRNDPYGYTRGIRVKMSSRYKKYLSCSVQSDEGMMHIYAHGKKAGRARVDVLDYYKRKVGTITVTVKNDRVKSIKADKNGINVDLHKKASDKAIADEHDLDKYTDTNAFDLYGNFKDGYTKNSVTVADYFRFKTSLYPKGYIADDDLTYGGEPTVSDKITMTSADPSVFSVSKNKKGHWIGKGMKSGSTTVTVKANGKTAVARVKVVDDHCTGIKGISNAANGKTVTASIASGNEKWNSSFIVSDYYVLSTDKCPTGYYKIGKDKYENTYSSDAVTVTSADSSIVEIKDGRAFGHKSGTTSITIACGGHSLTIPVKIKK